MKENTKKQLIYLLLLLGAGILAYSNSFRGAFLFDDEYTILANPHLKKLWPPRELFAAPPRSPLKDRPTVNLIMSLNYALGGLDKRWYHGFNLALHLAAAFLLFGILRRTFSGPLLAPRFGPPAAGLAFSITLIWLIHPLQTESVTYITQRCESLMGLCYLSVLYCLIRADRSGRSRLWLSAGVLLSALGLGAKASMVTVPFAALAYDRIFLAASWRELKRRRGWFYLGLFLTWLILAALLLTTSYAEIDKFTPLQYALTQPGVILHYLNLFFIPFPLCLDYSWPAVRTPGQVIPPALVIVALLGLTIWLLKKEPPLGYLGFWFFVTLAPTSTIMPLLDPAFEHRMYLPLAALVAAGIAGGYRLLLRLFPKSDNLRSVTGGGMVVLIAIPLILLTRIRNRDYESAEIIWRSVIRVAPENFRARMHLGNALLKEGKNSAAVKSYRESIRINPEYQPAYYNLANALRDQGKVDAAIRNYRRALEIKPEAVEVHNNLGALLGREGKIKEARGHFQESIRIDPDDPAAYFNLAVIELREGKCKNDPNAFSPSPQK